MIASGTARASKFERSARPSGLSACTWIKFKTLAEFKGCEISDFRGILKRCGISNARKISRSRARAFKDGAVSQVFAERRNCG